MLVKVAAYENAIEAHLARGRLEAEGVPAFVADDNIIWADWLYSQSLGGVKVYVHQQDAKRAAQIIGHLNRGDYALEEEKKSLVCPRCGSDRVRYRRMGWKSALLMANFLQIPLYFMWATYKCDACGNVWDLPNTRSYSLISLVLVGMLAALVLAFVFPFVGCVVGKVFYGVDFYECRFW